MQDQELELIGQEIFNSFGFSIDSCCEKGESIPPLFKHLGENSPEKQMGNLTLSVLFTRSLLQGEKLILGQLVKQIRDSGGEFENLVHFIFEISRGYHSSSLIWKNMGLAASVFEKIPEKGEHLKVSLGEISDRGGLFHWGLEKIVIVKRGLEYLAFGDACPHMGASLFEGEILDKEVICPLHGWRFGLQTGMCLSGHGSQLKRFLVRVEGEYLLVGPEII